MTIIADKNIIPKSHSMHYSEKVLYMPEIYQPLPLKFPITNSRSEFNLPENGFILGCFIELKNSSKYF